MAIRRLVRSDYELQDAADLLGVNLEDAARDMALLSVIASLVDAFGERIILKGGAALRFGHGATRLSGDADATITKPAKAPIPAGDVMAAIDAARMGQFLRFTVPKEPATANRYSLDIDQIQFDCAGVRGSLDVELSYREDIVLRPIPLLAGEPYFASFEILTMRPVEMVGEKLRTLAQRQRGTDLADWVLLEQLSKDDHQLLPQVRQKKFKLVRDSFGANELIARIDALQARYEADVRALDHSAPDFETARASAVRLVRLAWA